MNTPIYTRCAHDHLALALDKPEPEFTPEPRPTRHDAELVVAGIEARAMVRAGLRPLVGTQ
jgi:hypothetical protein